jgi:hypothetical protein
MMYQGVTEFKDVEGADPVVGELYVPTCYSSGRHEENHATGNKYN